MPQKKRINAKLKRPVDIQPTFTVKQVLQHAPKTALMRAGEIISKDSANKFATQSSVLKPMQASNNQPTYYVYASGASDTAGTQAVLTALTCLAAWKQHKPVCAALSAVAADGTGAAAADAPAGAVAGRV